MINFLDMIGWIIGGVIVGLLIILIFLSEPTTQIQKEARTKERVQLITLDNGVECAVLKGNYSDNAISCNWSK
jgi:hypothetical protein